MSKVPSLSYTEIVRALQRDGWTVVRQRGSHIRLQKRISDELLKITVPAHRPVKRSTLAHILKQARLGLERFLELVRRFNAWLWRRVEPVTSSDGSSVSPAFLQTLSLAYDRT